MGLNWSAGLEAAGQGMRDIATIKMKEWEMQYEDAREANRQRFQKEMQQNQQEFLTSQSESKQAWELENKIPLEERRVAATEEGVEVQRTGQETRLEELKLQGTRATQQHEVAMAGLTERQRENEIREASLTQKAEMESASEQRLTAKQRVEQYENEMKRIEKEIEDVEKRRQSLMTAEEDIPQLDQEANSLKQMKDQATQRYENDLEVIKLPKGQQPLYEEMNDYLGNAPMTHKVALAYAKMPEDKRAEIRAVATELQKADPQRFSSWKAAVAGAVMKQSSQSGAFGEPSTSSGKTPEAPTGNVPEPKSTTVIEGSSLSPKEQQLVERVKGKNLKYHADYIARILNEANSSDINIMRVLEEAGYSQNEIGKIAEILQPTKTRSGTAGGSVGMKGMKAL